MSKRPTICIDPGHGGYDSGAVGPSGKKESCIVLDVALRLARLLAGDFEVVMTRRDDRFVSLTGRAQIANVKGADLFLSVHCNSGPPGQGAGFEVWTSPGQTASDVAATRLYEAYADKFPMMPRRMDLSDGDVDKESKFTVLTATHMAAVLFELEFIHTPTGEDWLGQSKNWQACAQALADGVRDYFGMEVEETRDQKPETREEEAAPIVKPAPEPCADAAMMWQRMRAAGPLEAHIGLAADRDLIALRGYLCTQDPQGLIALGLGMIENEMIKRFIAANS